MQLAPADRTVLVAEHFGVRLRRTCETGSSPDTTPPLNPSFNWERWRTGAGIVFQGERTTTYTAVEAIPCPDGTWVYAEGTAYDTPW